MQWIFLYTTSRVRLVSLGAWSCNGDLDVFYTVLSATIHDPWHPSRPGYLSWLTGGHVNTRGHRLWPQSYPREGIYPFWKVAFVHMDVAENIWCRIAVKGVNWVVLWLTKWTSVLSVNYKSCYVNVANVDDIWDGEWQYFLQMNVIVEFRRLLHWSNGIWWRC